MMGLEERVVEESVVEESLVEERVVEGGGVPLPLFALVPLPLFVLLPLPLLVLMSLVPARTKLGLDLLSVDIDKDKSHSNSNLVSASVATVVACSWDEVASDDDKARSRMCLRAGLSWPLAGPTVAAGQQG